MDGGALFCLAHRSPSPALDVPGRALAWRTLLAFSYPSVGTSLRLDATVVTSTFSSSLASIRCICSADTSQREECGSDSKSCIYREQCWCLPNSSVYIPKSTETTLISSRHSQSCGGHLVAKCSIHSGCEYG